MDNQTLQKVKDLWETWDIRVFMLTSLLFQTLLTFLAPHRKRYTSGFLIFCIWLVYLSADAIALFTIGLIASNIDEYSQDISAKNGDLLTFWAPFLLLHLGGPDAITALALEDNELWHRHALQLATQVVITIYVFFQSFFRGNNGCIKFIERTEALYFASMDCFRDSLGAKPEPGPNYARFMEEYSSAANAHIPTSIQGKDGPSKGYVRLRVQSSTKDGSFSNRGVPYNTTYQVKETDEMIEAAYQFYGKYKCLVADAFLSLKDRDESQTFFLGKPGPEAFKIIEIELNFIYDVFFTKVFLLHRKRGFMRVICTICVIASSFSFYSSEKSQYDKTDVLITFALLGGAIALDICAALMLVLSDWWVIILYNESPKLWQSYLMRLLRWPRWVRRPCGKRWSETISQYNLLKRVFKDAPSVFNYIFVKRVKDFLIGILYVSKNPVGEQLIGYIIEELQMKAKLAGDTEVAKEVCSARGNLVLQDDYFLISEYLNPWTVDVDYDESLLTWHLATYICYWTTKQKSATSGNEVDYRWLSKELSDYMAYILLRQQALVSPVVGMSDIRFEDTCAEAKKFVNWKFDSWFAEFSMNAKKFVYKISLQQTSGLDETRQQRETQLLEEFCKKVLEVKTDVKPMTAKGDKSKSVLFDACRLAKQLKMIGDKQWEITSKVWVELLCYAAIRCPGRSHVARLSKGGELITLVWLLMTQLGLGEKFLQNQGFGWTK